MKTMRLVLVGGLALVLMAISRTPAPAGRPDVAVLEADLVGFSEVPPISTPARGHVRVEVHEDFILYTLEYSGLRANATAAHIHFAPRAVNGDVMVFLCGGAKPACPAREGRVEGMIVPGDVIASSRQGIAAGEFAAVRRAIVRNMSYANVHSTLFPPGEIRGELRGDHDDHQGDGD